MSFINEFTQLSQKERELHEQWENCAKRCNEIKQAIPYYYRILQDYHARHKGNIWLIFGVFFILLAVAITVLLFNGAENDIIGTTDGSIIGIWIWFSVPLIIGICRKIKGMQQYKSFILEHKSFQNVMQTCKELEQQLPELQAKCDQLWEEYYQAKTNLEELKTYDGRDWDLRTFKATPNNIQAMELDTEKIYVILQHLRSSELQNWHTNWIMYGNNGPNAARFQELGLSGSWKLQVTQVVLRFIHSVQPSNRHMPGKNEWDHLMKEANIRDAQTEAEQAYLNLAYTGALIMAQHRVEIFSKIPL